MFIPILIYKREPLELNSFKKVFIFLLIIQLVLAFLQYSGFLSSIFQKNLDDLRVFRGTFSNNNLLGNVLSLSGLIVFMELISGRNLNISRNLNLIILVVLVISLIFTGVRTSLLSFLLGVLIVVILNYKKIKLIKSLIFMFLAIIMIPVLSIFVNTSANSSSERIVSGLTNLLDSKTISESGTTLSFSARLINDFKSSDFFFGQGKLNKEGYFVVDSGKTLKSISVENKNITDATLILILVEFGIIGLLIFLLPLFGVKKIINDKKVYLPFLLLLISQTLTDWGIFFFATTVLALLYFKTLPKPEKN